MLALNGRLGNHPFTPGTHNINLRGLFIGGEVGLQIKVFNAFIMIEDPAAGGTAAALPGMARRATWSATESRSLATMRWWVRTETTITAAVRAVSTSS